MERCKNIMKYNTTLIQYPSGRYGFVGRVPADIQVAFDTVEDAINGIKVFGYELPQDYAVGHELLEEVKQLIEVKV